MHRSRSILLALAVCGVLCAGDMNVLWEEIICPQDGTASCKLGTDGTSLYYVPASDPATNFWKYDPAGDSWTQLACFPGHADEGDTGGGLDYRDGYLFTILKDAHTNAAGQIPNRLFRYSVAQNAWTYLTNDIQGAGSGTIVGSTTNTIYANWGSVAQPWARITWGDGSVLFSEFNCSGCLDGNWTVRFDTTMLSNVMYGVKNDWQDSDMTNATGGDVVWRKYNDGSDSAMKVATLPWNPGAGLGCVGVPASNAWSGANELVVVRGAGIGANQDGWGAATPHIALLTLPNTNWHNLTDLPLEMGQGSEITKVGEHVYVKAGRDDGYSYNDIMFKGTFVFVPGPTTPSNLTPAPGATGLFLAVRLSASPFVDADPSNTHYGSRWQLSATTNFDFPIWDSGESTHYLTNITLPPGLLTNSTRYYWRVRYKNSAMAAGEYSAPTWFETRPGGGAPPYVQIAWSEIVCPEVSGNGARLGSDGTYLYYISSISASFYRYTPESDLWEPLANLPGDVRGDLHMATGLDYQNGWMHTVVHNSNDWSYYVRYSIANDVWELLDTNTIVTSRTVTPSSGCWARPDGEVAYAPLKGIAGYVLRGEWATTNMGAVPFSGAIADNWLCTCVDTATAPFDDYVYGTKNDWDSTNGVSSGDLLWCVPQWEVTAGKFRTIRLLPWAPGAGVCLVALPVEQSMTSNREIFVVRGAGGGEVNQDGFTGYSTPNCAVYFPDFNAWAPASDMPFETGMGGTDVTMLRGKLYVKICGNDIMFCGEPVPEPLSVWMLVLPALWGCRRRD